MKSMDKKVLKRAAFRGLKKYHMAKHPTDKGNVSPNENAVDSAGAALTEPIRIIVHTAKEIEKAAHKSKETARRRNPEEAAVFEDKETATVETHAADPQENAGHGSSAPQGICISSRDGRMVSDNPQAAQQKPPSNAPALGQKEPSAGAAGFSARQAPADTSQNLSSTRDIPSRKMEQEKNKQLESKRKKLEKNTTDRGRQLAQKEAGKAAAKSGTGAAAQSAAGSAAATGNAAAGSAGGKLFLIFGSGIIILLILLCAALIFTMSTAFGLFYVDDGSIRNAILRINEEYEEAVADIADGIEHDDLDMSAAQTDWRSVLAVYAAHIIPNTGDVDFQELATMTDARENLLRKIFWDMHSISSRTDTYEEIVPVLLPGKPGNGNFTPIIIGGDQYWILEKTRLYISVAHVSAYEMANRFQFTDEQLEQLSELLADENITMWDEVLYGISSGGDGVIVSTAAAEVGNDSGEVYLEWYGSREDTAWSAVFVSWCANKCGYIRSGLLPKTDSIAAGAVWFKNQGLWAGSAFTPAPGDIIFIDRNSDGTMDHVGVVEYVADGTVHTIEGDRDDSVTRDSYTLAGKQIIGYGIPNYELN